MALILHDMEQKMKVFFSRTSSALVVIMALGVSTKDAWGSLFALGRGRRNFFGDGAGQGREKNSWSGAG